MGLSCTDTAEQPFHRQSGGVIDTLDPITINTRDIYIVGESNLLIVSQQLSKAPSSCYLYWAILFPVFTEQHDDVIKWKHFPRYWPFVRRIHRSPVNSPHKG